jgi:hypothetical protein
MKAKTVGIYNAQGPSPCPCPTFDVMAGKVQPKAEFTVDSTGRVVFSHFAGILTLEVVVDHMTRLKAVPAFLPEFRQLVDFRDIIGVPLSSRDVQALAQHSVFSSSSRRAFLATPGLQFGLCRMFATHRDSNGEPNIAVFRNLSDACRWIDCDEQYATGRLDELRQLGGSA